MDTWISLKRKKGIDFMGELESAHGGEWKDQVGRGGEMRRKTARTKQHLRGNMET